MQDFAFHVQFVVSDVTQMPSSSIRLFSSPARSLFHSFYSFSSDGGERGNGRRRVSDKARPPCMSYNPLLSFCAAECHVPQLSISQKSGVHSEVRISQAWSTFQLRISEQGYKMKPPQSEMGFASRTLDVPRPRADFTSCQICLDRTMVVSMYGVSNSRPFACLGARV